MPYTTVVAGTTITASWSNASVRDQVVTPFATTAARDSAITSPVDGMLEVVTDDDQFYTYNGTTWENALMYGDWASYTPALTASTTSPTLGTGSFVSGAYMKVGRTIIGRARIQFGTSGTAAGSGTYRISLPVAPISVATVSQVVAQGFINDASAAAFQLVSCYNSAGATYCEMIGESISTVTEASPWAWAASDILTIQFNYEAAA